MFKVTQRTDKCVRIRSVTEDLILSKIAFLRIKGRKSRGAKIRNPIEILIDGATFVFTRQEWKKGKRKALEHERFPVDVLKVQREEILDKVKMSKRLSELRSWRLKLDADTAKNRDLENKYIWNRVTINEPSKRKTR